MSNSNFDKNGIDSSGTHWYQYLAFSFTILFVIVIWLYFRDENFQFFIQKVFKIINCSGFNCNGAY